MAIENYYQILGIEQTVDQKEIKKVYRKLSLKLHPDVNPVDDGGEEFKRIAQAYEVLKDSKRRAKYDEWLKYNGSNGDDFAQTEQQHNNTKDTRPNSGHHKHYSNNDFADLFRSAFGENDFNNSRTNGQQRKRSAPYAEKGQDAEIDLPMQLEETLVKTERTITYSIPLIDNGHLTHVSKTLKVTVPMGVKNNERIRLKGQAGPGYGKGLNGDLYLHIRLIPHPNFDVEENNLILTIPIAPWEAALGAIITVPTLTGKIKVTIKANSQTGQKLRLKGKGLQGKASVGDMIGLLKIVVPSQNKDSEQRLWQELQSLSAFNPRQQWSD